MQRESKGEEGEVYRERGQEEEEQSIGPVWVIEDEAKS